MFTSGITRQWPKRTWARKKGMTCQSLNRSVNMICNMEVSSHFHVLPSWMTLDVTHRFLCRKSLYERVRIDRKPRGFSFENFGTTWAHFRRQGLFWREIAVCQSFSFFYISSPCVISNIFCLSLGREFGQSPALSGKAV